MVSERTVATGLSGATGRLPVDYAAGIGPRRETAADRQRLDHEPAGYRLCSSSPVIPGVATASA